ncbi:MAG: hypothetical protein ABMB14_41220, partial [Myxococcota bacterium]
MIPVPAGHTLGAPIREDDHEWVVRTRLANRSAMTRIGKVVLPDGADGAVRAAVLVGEPLDERWPWEVRRVLDGYRVRAALPVDEALPTVLAAGLADGRPFVTRAWIDGVRLHQAPARDASLDQLLALLARLHARRVLVQDLKPDNTVVDPFGRVWLVDLESLRAAPSGVAPCTHYTPRFAAPEQLRGRTSAAASDLYAFGRVVTELYGGSPGPRWSAIVAACLAEDPLARPTAGEACGWLRGGNQVDPTIRIDEPILASDVPRLPDARQTPIERSPLVRSPLDRSGPDPRSTARGGSPGPASRSAAPTAAPEVAPAVPAAAAVPASPEVVAAAASGRGRRWGRLLGAVTAVALAVTAGAAV